MLIFMMPLLIIGVILLILVFTAYKSLTCSNKSETLACNLWRLAHVLTAALAVWQVYIKFQKVRAEAKKTFSPPTAPETKAPAPPETKAPAVPDMKTPAAPKTVPDMKTPALPMLAPPPAL